MNPQNPQSRQDPPSSPGQPPPLLIGRIARTATGTVLMLSLAVACFTWIQVSQPFDPGQMAALNVRLDPQTAQAAATLPTSQGSVVALTYHGVSDTDHASTTVTRKVFSEHLAALAAAGYRTVRLADVEHLLAGRPVKLPERALLLTFDGGQLTDWTTVDPVLKQYHYTAVAFLTTGKIVEPGTHSYYLSTRQLTDLQATGRWEFGTRGNDLDNQMPVAGGIAPPMTNLITVDGKTEALEHWRTRIARDLAASRSFFQSRLHQNLTALSYPWGETGATGNQPLLAVELPRLLAAAGFTEAFIGEEVPVDDFGTISAQSAPWQLHRLGIRATTSVADLVEMIRTAIPAAPPRELAPLPWLGDLATCTPRGADLQVASSTYGTCQLTGYNTLQWTDYTIHTTVTGVTTSSQAVITVRDGDGANHDGWVEVHVGAKSVSILEQLGDGAKLQLGSASLGKMSGSRNVTIALRGAQIRAWITGARPLTVSFDPRLDAGGVQFAISTAGPHTITFGDPTITSTSNTKIKTVSPKPLPRTSMPGRQLGSRRPSKGAAR